MSTGSDRSGARRAARAPWTAALVVAICLVPTGLSLDRAVPATSPLGALPANPLASAVSSLESGAGPLGGAGVHCSVSYLSGSCTVAQSARVSSSSGGLWWNLTSLVHTMPVPRVGAYLTDDVADGYVLLFGGTNLTVVYGDTWKFSGGAWTQLFPATTPSARGVGGMVYDSADGYVVLYAGANNSAQYLETWKFSGGTWTELFPATSPPNIEAFGMTYDAADHAAVLFGGINMSSTELATTWEFAHGEWTELSPAASPPARDFPMLTYDPTDGYVVLFGGQNQTGVSFSDTWRFVGGAWTELNPTPAPSARAAADMAWDPTLGAIVLYGGTNGTFQPTDTWLFRAGAWTMLSISTTPGGNLLGQITFDSEDGYLLAFSGDTKDLGGHVDPITWAFSPIVSVAPGVTQASEDAGLSDHFTSNAANGVGPYSYNWSFGHGQFSALANPTNVFPTAGTYRVNLTVTDLTGTQATGSVTVTVVAALAAKLMASPNSTTVGSNVRFQATLSGGVAPFTYNWSFGDGAFTTNSTPTHTFGSAQAYIVELKVTDSAGASSNATIEVRVQPASSGPSSGAIALIVIVVLVALAAVGGFLWWRRKGGSSPSMPPPMNPVAPAQPLTPAPPPPPPPPV